jgi:prepilin-type N-terminal cleavage/methylation domain-containing protein
VQPVNRPHRPWRAEPQRPRQGFTLIEIVVSMLILVVGILSMAGTSAMLSRQMGGARQQTVASLVAQGRIEQLRSVSCKSIAGGSALTRGVTEVWVKKDTARAVIIIDTVKYVTPRGPRLQVFWSTIPCPPNT